MSPRTGDDDAARAELARRFSSLTPQQMKILRLICPGKANKEISYELSIAEANGQDPHHRDHVQDQRPPPHAGGAAGQQRQVVRADMTSLPRPGVRA